MVGGDEWMLTYACRKVMEFAAAIKG